MSRKRAIGYFAVPVLVVLGWSTWVVGTLPNVSHLSVENPDETALMRQRAREAEEEGKAPRRAQQWLPIDDISERLIQAVVMAEDAAFYTHSGFDLHEMRQAVKRNWEEGKTVRGASTITQQLAKNLFLSTDRTYSRKLKEAVLTYRLEKALTKKRILELYLNVIEWGDGVYGAEAAARRVLGKSASSLNAIEAATLAAMIPSPRRLDPCERPEQVKTRRDRVLRWMRMADHIDDEELEELLARDLSYVPCSGPRN